MDIISGNKGFGAGYSTIIMKVPTQTTNIIEIPIKKYFIKPLPLGATSPA
ncbi:hypothetical protein yfred0001_37520 [Yersinia frederiksenii ATCC 33641]|nr:hypothetical protein yfred0001_37520 [Yersinia frederiksenii ATCC 33641]